MATASSSRPDVGISWCAWACPLASTVAVLAAPHEAPDRAHQLVGARLELTGLALENAVSRVPVEEAERDLVDAPPARPRSA